MLEEFELLLRRDELLWGSKDYYRSSYGLFNWAFAQSEEVVDLVLPLIKILIRISEREQQKAALIEGLLYGRRLN